MNGTLNPFEKNNYLSQTRKIRKLAVEAMNLYSIHPVEIKFIGHTDNTTYRVTSSNNKKYLLRIHRQSDFDSNGALQEELEWLQFLSKKKFFNVPKPVVSKNNRVIETAVTVEVGSRHVCLFEWIDRHFIDTSVTEKKMFKLGELLANLQTHISPKKIKHRISLDAEGLVGSNPKFGSIDSLTGITTRQQKIITQGRQFVLAKLLKFQKKFPNRLGLIHGDLHFGNILSLKNGELSAIDFDDCGFGFHAYDLVMPIISLQSALGERRKQHMQRYLTAFFNGYKSIKSWDNDDDEVLVHLRIARGMLMLGWINSQPNNPRLSKILMPRVVSMLKSLKRNYQIT